MLVPKKKKSLGTQRRKKFSKCLLKLPMIPGDNGGDRLVLTPHLGGTLVGC